MATERKIRAVTTGEGVHIYWDDDQWVLRDAEGNEACFGNITHIREALTILINNA